MAAITFQQTSGFQIKTDLQVREYKPGQKVYAGRISEYLWQQMRPFIVKLRSKGKTRKQMLDILARQYDFHPSVSQLDNKVHAWDWHDHQTSKASSRSNRSQEQTTIDIPQSEPVSIPDKPNTDFSWSSTVLDSASDPVTAQFYDNQSVNPVDSTAGKMLNILDQSPITSMIDQVCTLHDIAEFLAYSPWGSSYSFPLMKWLIDTTRTDVLSISSRAHVMLLRDCFRWSIAWKDESKIDWLFHTLHTVPIVPMSHEGRGICRTSPAADDCLSIATNLYPFKDWRTGQGSGVMVPDVMSVDVGLSSLPYENPILSSDHDSLIVEAGSDGLLRPITEEVIHDIRAWCEQHVDRFESHFRKTRVGNVLSGLQALHYFGAELTEFFIREWIEFTNKAAAGKLSGAEMGSTPYPMADILLFRLIARTIATMCLLAVQRARKYLLAYRVGLSDADRRASNSAEVTNVLRNALHELQADTQNIYQRIYRCVPDIEDDNAVQGLPDQVVNLTSLLVGEFGYIREKRQSVRHQHALCTIQDFVVRSHVKTESAHGPDAMLCEPKSTSSFRSFRQAGIKLKDRYGPPSMSGCSSVFLMSYSLNGSPTIPVLGTSDITSSPAELIKENSAMNAMSYVSTKF